MKKIMILGLVAMLVFGVAAYVYGSATIGAGGPHNMPAKSAVIEVDATGQPCAFCHTPHNSSASNAVGPEIPLRNRTTTGSSFCMSCHDGASNVSAGIVNQPSTANLTGGNLIASSIGVLDPAEHVLGGSGHPINADYPDGGGGTRSLRTIGNAVIAVNAGANLRRPVVAAELDPVICSSCHDVHNNQANASPFLRIANNSSQLCVACHDL